MQNLNIGKLLVASTVTDHPIYAGGVCLVVHEDADHTIGVMLNRPMQPNEAAMTALMNAAAQDAADAETTDVELAESDMTDGDERSSIEDDIDASVAASMELYGDPSAGEDDWSSDADGDAEFDEDDAAIAGDSSRDPSQGSNRVASYLNDDDSLTTDATGMTPLGQLHFGGPVSGPVVALHGSSELAEMETGAGIYVAAQKDHLEELVRQQSDRFRLIVGHLRWAPGALQSEIDAGLWHCLPAKAEEVFAPAAGMWPRLVRRATSRSLAHWIGATDLVDAASWN